ncbi:MAG: MotE family protein [Alphaproteobacteria bacterium]
MDERLKILPMVALAALALFTVKAVDLWTGLQGSVIGISEARAGAAPAEKAQPTDESGAEKANKDKAKPKTIEHTPGLGYAEFKDMRDPALISESEVRVLESLSERRTQIDAREKELALKMTLLEATEKRVQQRIDDLKVMEGRIEALLEQRDEQAEAQIASLVKVYENMKAKDAARIFENLESNILLSVAGRMREQKIAAILAQMRPESAQALTVMLARRFTALETGLDG